MWSRCDRESCTARPRGFMEVRGEEEKKSVSSSLSGQVDLETRPRSILEEKKDTGLN